MINYVHLIGYLGQDPNLSYSKNGLAIAKFTLATSKSFKKNNQWESKSQWHSAVIFGQLAEGIANVLSKGSLVAVVGELDYNEYEDKQGVKRKIAVIKVKEYKKLNNRKSDDQLFENDTEYQRPEDDEIPF